MQRIRWDKESLSYQMLIIRPSAHRQNEFLVMNIRKASVFHPAFEFWPRRRLDLCFARGIDEFVVELE